MLMRRRFFIYVYAVAVSLATLGAQPDIATIGPQVGATLPAFTLVDQAGRTHTLQSVMGAKGAMLVFFRSADW
jgi:phage tail protein X